MSLLKTRTAGKNPESEPETRALADLLCKSVQSPGTTGDPSITWLFDIHGQDAIHSKVSYPWSWAENQTRDSGMCIANPYYNPPPPHVREGFVSYSVNPSAYGEYLPQKTADQLQELAETFTGAAKQGHVASKWEMPTQGSAPTRGTPAFPCVGALDDYFLWQDRNHCRAFTIECAHLQPPGAIKDYEMDEVASGLFAAIKQIKDWVVASSNPQQELSRLSTDQLTCP
ncbi:MAG TPA: M14 family zinc carboxypeptidase [Candidatus Angelobacter sp.]